LRKQGVGPRQIAGVNCLLSLGLQRDNLRVVPELR
jgi:hypothetical protein